MELVNKTILNYLFNYPEMCIYGLINHKDHKIYVGYTANLPLALSRIIRDTKYSNNKLNKDWDKLEFAVLETVTDRKNLRIKYNQWIKEYSNKGWDLYKKQGQSNIPTYKLRIDLWMDESRWTKEDQLVYVRLITRRYKELTVGVFNDYDEAVRWSKDNYPNTTITQVIYAKNALTEEYLDSWK